MKKHNFVLLCARRGFSILELGFALLTISLILAAFAPVITSRGSDDIAISRQKSATTECSEFSEFCAVCFAGNKCLLCERECSSGQTLDVSNCKCN